MRKFNPYKSHKEQDEVKEKSSMKFSVTPPYENWKEEAAMAPENLYGDINIKLSEAIGPQHGDVRLVENNQLEMFNSDTGLWIPTGGQVVAESELYSESKIPMDIKEYIQNPNTSFK
jgi:hypothetical protein